MHVARHEARDLLLVAGCAQGALALVEELLEARHVRQVGSSRIRHRRRACAGRASAVGRSVSWQRMQSTFVVPPTPCSCAKAASSSVASARANTGRASIAKAAAAARKLLLRTMALLALLLLERARGGSARTGPCPRPRAASGQFVQSLVAISWPRWRAASSGLVMSWHSRHGCGDACGNHCRIGRAVRQVAGGPLAVAHGLVRRVTGEALGVDLGVAGTARVLRRLVEQLRLCGNVR